MNRCNEYNDKYVKNEKNAEKKQKDVCKRWTKYVNKIGDQSNYYICAAESCSFSILKCNTY